MINKFVLIKYKRAHFHDLMDQIIQTVAGRLVSPPG